MIHSLSEIKIAIIGLGYVGLPLAVEFGKQRDIIGFDINELRINQLNEFNDVTLEVSQDELKNASGLKFSNTLESIKDYKIPFGESILSWGPDKHLGANDAFLFVVQDGKFIQVDDVMYTY